MTCVVYWLHDATCVCPWRHGYVGVTSRFERRIARHKRENRFPDFKVSILFRGTIEQCHALELQLRPNFQIGWNVVKGGRSGAAMAGMPKPLTQREKMRATAVNWGGHFKGPHTPEASAKMRANTYKARGLTHPAKGRTWTAEERVKLVPKRRAVIFLGSPAVLKQQASRAARSDYLLSQKAKGRRNGQYHAVRKYGDSSWILGI